MAELAVALGSARSFVLFLRGLERIAARPQQTAHRRRGDRVPLLLERLLEMTDALGGPLEQAHRVPLGVQESFQIDKQRRIERAQAFPPPAPAPDTIPRHVGVSALDLCDPRANGLAGHVCVTRHLTDPATPQLLGFHREIKPPLPLVERGPHQIEGRWRLVLFHHASIAQHPFTWIPYLGEATKGRAASSPASCSSNAVC